MHSLLEVPESVTKAFGDLGRFEEVLRDGYGVGKMVDYDEPYTQYAGIPGDAVWHELLRDEKTQLFLPAAIAVQAIVTSEAIKAHDAGNTTKRHWGEFIYLRSYQLPADDIGPQEPGARGYDNTSVRLREFMDQYDLNRKELHGGTEHEISGRTEPRVTEDELSELRRRLGCTPSFKAIVETETMHLDYQRTGVALLVLASSSRPTLGPTGTTVVNMELDNSRQDWQINIASWDEASLREIAAPGRVGLATGHMAHTRSFGDYALAYIEPSTGFAERRFTQLLAFLEY